MTPQPKSELDTGFCREDAGKATSSGSVVESTSRLDDISDRPMTTFGTTGKKVSSDCRPSAGRVHEAVGKTSANDLLHSPSASVEDFVSGFPANIVRSRHCRESDARAGGYGGAVNPFKPKKNWLAQYDGPAVEHREGDMNSPVEEKVSHAKRSDRQIGAGGPTWPAHLQEVNPSNGMHRASSDLRTSADADWLEDCQRQRGEQGKRRLSADRSLNTLQQPAQTPPLGVWPFGFACSAAPSTSIRPNHKASLAQASSEISWCCQNLLDINMIRAFIYKI
ncbi:unnamed protein product [Protopolystoma xenopodis]|uniref:Uncharacterized protein n=1 Tax=Protopolystoma xenopodis TaxID=117903 RepID=A0A448WGU5_9PLAT|nr:unnamed protein product [Protopolystoma xenopodis]